MDSEELPLGNRSGWILGKERTPPEFGIPAGVGLDDQPYSDLRLSPSGLLEPAGRFHRGATRGELVMTTAGGIDRCLAR